jgi:general secretion pathway protein A
VTTYIAHRLSVSGASPLIFPDKLINKVSRASGGVPRLINLICDRALLGAYVQGQPQVSLPILNQAVKEILPENSKRKMRLFIAFGLAALVGGLGIFFVAQLEKSNLNWSQFLYSHSSAAATSSKYTVQTNAAPTSSLVFPGDISDAQSERLAFQSLFKLYGIDTDLASAEAPCKQIESLGMRCYVGHGGLSDLFQLDQPVLLRLSPVKGKEFLAVLTALDHHSASLLISGKTQRVSLNEIAPSWSGQFIAVWKAPPAFNAEINLNHRGQDVIWLRRTLENIDGIRDNGSDVFDLALSKRIRAFQLNDGIQPDGLVGPLTLIRLNVRSGKNMPHLVTERKG